MGEKAGEADGALNGSLKLGFHPEGSGGQPLVLSELGSVARSVLHSDGSRCGLRSGSLGGRGAPRIIREAVRRAGRKRQLWGRRRGRRGRVPRCSAWVMGQSQEPGGRRWMGRQV